MELIRARSSHRKYRDEPLAPDLLEQARALVAAPPAAPFGSPARFALLADAGLTDEDFKLPGTYGMISGARAYLVGATTAGSMAWEDFGYRFEALVLGLTALGLGTCWIGGTFHRGRVGSMIQATADEIIPAISPVGLTAAKRGLLDRVVRWGAGSATRKPWEELFFDGDPTRPLARMNAGRLADAFEAVRLGPSASNKQPWRLVKDGLQVHLLLRRTPGYARLIGAVDLQRLDMGIAMCHFDLVARERGVAGRWRTDPQSFDHPDYVASWSPV